VRSQESKDKSSQAIKAAWDDRKAKGIKPRSEESRLKSSEAAKNRYANIEERAKMKSIVRSGRPKKINAEVKVQDDHNH